MTNSWTPAELKNC